MRGCCVSKLYSPRDCGKSRIPPGRVASFSIAQYIFPERESETRLWEQQFVQYHVAVFLEATEPQAC